MTLFNFLALGASGGGGVPSWVLRSGGQVAVWDVDFVNNQAIRNGDVETAASQIAITRASAAYYENFDGSLTLFSSGAARIGNRGLLRESSRTNVVLHNRDLTNAAWTKSNATAAKDQVGPDGVANSASSLIATAGNGTCLQAITLASSARFQTAYIKRLVGTGNVQMTMDNGSTWTTVTVTAAWTRVRIASQTLANPTVGFRIVTNGDSIAVDFVQNEDGAFPTSPISVTTIAVTRAADVVTAANFGEFYNQPEGTIFCDCVFPEFASGTMWSADDNSGNEQIINRVSSGTNQYFIRDGNVLQGLLSSANAVAGQTYRSAAAYKLNDMGVSSQDTAAATDTSVTIPTPTQFAIGHAPAGGIDANCYIQRIAYWPTRVSDANLRVLSQSNVSFIFLDDGDSITVRPDTATCFPAVAQGLMPRTLFQKNNGVSQSRIVYGANPALDLTVRGSTLDADLAKYIAANPSAKKATVIHIGRNDIGDDVANSTIMSQLVSYANSRRSAGHYLGICTILPDGTNVKFATNRAILNPQIRALVGVNCDFVVDWDLTIMGSTDAVASDTTYYEDGTHPTAVGAAILGGYLQTLLSAI